MVNMRWLSHRFPNNDFTSIYESLETLEIYRYFGISLTGPADVLYFRLAELANYCKMAREILRYHPHLSVRAHTTVKDRDATDQSCIKFRIRWRLLRSPSVIHPKVCSSEGLPLRRYCQLSSDGLIWCPGTHP